MKRSLAAVYSLWIRKLGALALDKKKLSLLAAFLLLLFYLDLAFLFRAQVKAINALGPRISRLKKDKERLVKNLALMGNLKQGARSFQDPGVKIKKIISLEEGASLIQGLSGLANNYRLKILRIDSGKEIKIKKITLGDDQGGGFESFANFAITINASGDYHSLGSFISGLSQLEAIISVESLNILPGPEDNRDQLATLIIRAYVKR